MDIKIEKNAPMPERKGGWGKWQQLVTEMDFGDAVTFRDDKNLTAYHGMRRAAKQLGFNVVMRTLDDGQIRVWKQKD